MIVRPFAAGVEVLAPAKLNMFLEILGRRRDGYHELETLMVTIDLVDVLTFHDDPSGVVSLECNDMSTPRGSENLVVRAAERLRAWARSEGEDRPLGAAITLDKRIPARAGLGGGSSDAAATLAGLDRLWNLGTPAERLDALAGELGSDVPFFGRNAKAAICRGRGEVVEPLADPHPLTLVLIEPPLGVSTESVYRHVSIPDKPRSVEPVRAALLGGDVVELGRLMFNRLQEVAESLVPDLVPIRRALADLGSSLDGRLMSGSGSTYFGLCRDGQAAQDAARRLGELGLGRVRVVAGGVN
jgi:4-diphosphocytidyl-2-C-methyl-D-erythritol kinase